MAPMRVHKKVSATHDRFAGFSAWCLRLVLALMLQAFARGAAPVPALLPAAPNLGIEGRASVLLPKADYRPRPLDDRTELILRLEKIVPATNGQYAYDFYYLGLEPGLYRLADFLIRPDGTRPDELREQLIQVRARLPDDHDGRLNTHRPSLFPFIGGYRLLLTGLGLLWIGGLATFIYVSRSKPGLVAPAALIQPPSLAERMRPLVEAAAAGQLDVDGQAQLERLLMGYWREKLAPEELRMAEALARLKTHREAGALLRALERWLHRPGGVAAEEIAALLQPYRRAPAGLEQEGAT